ncbi:reverse transcriptase domain-containing protein [Tanacetum coccineum]
MPRDCLRIIESKSKVRNSRNKPVVAKVSSSSSTTGISSDVAELKDMVKALLLDKKTQAPAPVKAVEEIVYEKYAKPKSKLAKSNDQFNGHLSKFVNSNTASTSSSGSLPSNTITNPKLVERETEVTKDNGPMLLHRKCSEALPKPSNYPYPTRLNDQTIREKADNQIEKFYQIFQDFHFEISFADALILMPKFASTLKSLIGNKEKLSKMSRTPLNEHCSAVLLKKLLEKLGDTDKFLIPCDFPGMDECLALVDLSASINLMPLSVWKRLSSFRAHILHYDSCKLRDRSIISQPIGIAEDVDVKVGKFQFPADFVVVDFDADPRVPLILGRSFLKTGRALIDVYEGELTLRVGKEAITFNLDQTSRYSSNYDDNSVKRIDVIEMACEEYSQELLGFSDVIASGNPTLYYDPIVSTSSPTLTPFGDSDFLLEEVDAFLALEDDPTSPEVDDSYYDPEGDILLLEAFLNDDPSLPPPTQGNYLPEIQKEHKVCKAKNDKSLIDEPLEVEFKDLAPHVEYAFLEGDDKLPVIIVKDLSVEEKVALIKILMEEDYKLAVQHQRWVNLKIQDVIKKEVEKLLDAGLSYPILDSPWVSPVHCVPKKGGFTVVENDENELIPTRLVTGWRVYIDYQNLNEATRKDHFPLPFMDQILERLAGNEYYCFLDGCSGYFQIPIDPHNQEKTTFTCPYGTFAYRRMPFGLCNAPGMFQRCMMDIFHDMIEKIMEVFMDNFLVFRNSFRNCLSRIVLDHKISKNGIKVDKAKVDVIAKLPHPTIVKGVQSFLDHAAFETLKKKLTEAPILIAPNWDLPFELMCDASDFAIALVYTDHSAIKYLFAKNIQGEIAPMGSPPSRVQIQKIPITLGHPCDTCQRQENYQRDENCHKISIPSLTKNLTVWGIDFNGVILSSREQIYTSSTHDFLSKGIEAKALPTNDESDVVFKFLKSTLLARFGAPRAIISDRGTHFCNDEFEKFKLKYRVTHRLSTAYHPQTSGQVEVSNRGLKRILERTVGREPYLLVR